MALLTRKGYTNLVAKAVNLEAEGVQDIVTQLAADFDEREAVLAKYGTSYDDQADTYEYVERGSDAPTPSPDTIVEKPIYDKLKADYEALKTDYITRFMGGTPADETKVIDDTETRAKNITLDNIVKEEM